MSNIQLLDTFDITDKYNLDDQAIYKLANEAAIRRCETDEVHFEYVKKIETTYGGTITYTFEIYGTKTKDKQNKE